jgi:hypothetical protein
MGRNIMTCARLECHPERLAIAMTVKICTGSQAQIVNPPLFWSSGVILFALATGAFKLWRLEKAQELTCIRLPQPAMTWTNSFQVLALLDYASATGGLPTHQPQVSFQLWRKSEARTYSRGRVTMSQHAAHSIRTLGYHFRRHSTSH